MKTVLIDIQNALGVHSVFKPLFDMSYIVNSAPEFHQVFAKESKEESRIVVLFGGGADVHPSLYNAKRSRYNAASSSPTDRDMLELAAFKTAKKYDVGMLGICRGAQLICGLSGGTLYQHVVGHGVGHNLVTNEGEVFRVSSAHHQMMRPDNIKHEILAYSQEVISRVHLDENDKEVKVKEEPEVVWFPETKGLALQYHPEFMSPDSRGYKYAQELVTKYLLKGEK